MKKAIDLAMSKFSFISCAVNCAGIGTTRKTIVNSLDMAHDLQLFERVLKVSKGIKIYLKIKLG